MKEKEQNLTHKLSGPSSIQKTSQIDLLDLWIDRLLFELTEYIFNDHIILDTKDIIELRSYPRLHNVQVDSFHRDLNHRTQPHTAVFKVSEVRREKKNANRMPNSNAQRQQSRSERSKELENAGAD